MTLDLKGKTPESWACVDCGINTAPGIPTRVEMERIYNTAAVRMKLTGEDPATTPVTTYTINEYCEIYIVRDSVWKAAGLEPMGGCLCIGCLEQRIGRQLRPKDFTRHVFNNMPGTDRLLQRRGAR